MFLFKFLKNKEKKERGFLLVEMIISVAIFSAVMVIGIGSLLSILSSNKRAEQYKIVVNNINLAVESISRGLRFGRDYNCGSLIGGDCLGGGSSIYFKSKSSQETVYKLDNFSIKRSVAGSSFVSITADDVKINYLKFYVTGSGNPLLQPKVVIVVNGETNHNTKFPLSFGIQTTVSKRSVN